jgi:hypothetical protein
MNGLYAFGWGAFGGFALEALDFWRFSRTGRSIRWDMSLLDTVVVSVGVIFRVAVGGGLALAASQSGQVSGSMGALGIGVAAPLVLERLSKDVPVVLGVGGMGDAGGAGYAAEPPPPVGPAGGTGAAKQPDAPETAKVMSEAAQQDADSPAFRSGR